MQCFWRVILRLGWIVALAILSGPRPGVAQEPLLYAAVGDITRPPIGALITLGKTPGRVVRHVEGGFAIEFTRLQHPDFLEENIASP